MESTLIIEEKKLDVSLLRMDNFQLDLPEFDNTKNGTEYKLECSSLDLSFENDTYMVRCHDFTAKAINDGQPNISIGRIEFYGVDDEINISHKEAYILKQTIIKTLER